jgi:epoxyqueuosine reductase
LSNQKEPKFYSHVEKLVHRGKNMSNLTDETKKVAFSSGMDYVGVASLERFKNAPDGWKPTDLLSSCGSVVSVGLKIGEGVRTANQRAYSGLRHGIYIYMVFGYTLLNERLDLAAFRISRSLEKKGYVSIPIPSAAPSDPYMSRGAFSHRHAAVAAGLGEFGWNGLLVTPEAGPRVRLATILTEAELSADSMYSKEKLCNKEECSVCVSVCPTNAISKDEGVKIEIGGKTFEYAKVDKVRCRYGINGLIKKALGRQDIQIPNNPTPEDYLKALSKENPWQKMERLASMCGRCIINCPAPKTET